MKVPKGCVVVPFSDVAEHVEGLDGGYDGNVVFAKSAVEWPADLELDLPKKKDKENIVGYVFAKDLTVKRDIVNADGDTGRFVVVAGKLAARNIIAGGAEILASKSATASGIVFAHYNHGTLRVGGALTAKALINDAHDIDVEGKTEALTICVDSRNDMIDPDFVYEDAPRILVKTVLGKSGGADETKLIAAIREGTNVLIKGATPSREHLAAALTKVRKPVALDLTGKKLPATLWKMIDLEELTLGEIEKLPGDLGKLTSLRSLIIKNASIEKLPAEVGKLPLERLVLHRTSVKELPASLVKRNALRRLELGPVEALPGGVLALTNLEELVVDGSADSSRSLTIVPDEIATLTKLRVLDLISNQLSGLPASIATLSNLEELRLRYVLAKVDAIPDLSKLPKLRVLHFNGHGGGGQSAPPAGLLQRLLTFALPQLEELNVSDWNKRITPAQVASLARFPKLRVLDLSGSRLTRVPDEVLALPMLEELRLTNNQLDVAEQQRVFAALPNAKLDLRSQTLPDKPLAPELKTARELVSAGRNAVTSSYDFATALKRIDEAIAILETIDAPRELLSAHFEKLGVYSTFVDSKKPGHAEAKQQQTAMCWTCLEQCALAGQMRRLTDDIAYQNEVLRQCANHLALQLTAKAKPPAADVAQAVSLIERAAATLEGDSNRFIRATHASVLLKAGREDEAWAVVRAAYEASAGNEELAALRKDKRYQKWSAA